MGNLKPSKTNTANKASFTLDAVKENLSAVQDIVHDFIKPAPSTMRTRFELDMIVEELFINVASYAYTDKKGKVSMDLSLNEACDTLSLTFRDRGIPYDPLLRESPDITASIEDRPIGGLGIFLVQKYVDDIFYKYADGENCLTIVKKLR